MERELMAHLFRRAGFGATQDELDAALAKGYGAVVEELLHPEFEPGFDDYQAYRYHVGMKESRLAIPAQAYWIYRMINTRRPLEEKLALFWHSLFATAFAKLNCAKPLVNQVAMFRAHCLGSYRVLLGRLAQDPAMIYWLDNNENTKDEPNENFGRELLELFTLGIGNYSEADIKACARSFTGWTFREEVPSDLPYGRFEWVFDFRSDLHDYGPKEFLGRRGNFDGKNIIDIILEQPTAAHYLAYRLHKFFVSDQPEVNAVDELAAVCRRTDYDLREIMRSLLTSPAFCSERARYSKVKSPVEFIVGLIRLTGDFETPRHGIEDVVLSCGYMGQSLLDPPTVEGWHTGVEWIDTAALMERIGFAVKQVSNPSLPGLRQLTDGLSRRTRLSVEAMVDEILYFAGPLEVSGRTRDALLDFARHQNPVQELSQRVVDLLQMVVATREFQMT